LKTAGGLRFAENFEIMYINILETILNEETYNKLLRKQASIGRLFPNFSDRVKKVAQKGGVKLVDMQPEVWHFKVNSASKDGVRYDNYIRFLNIVEILKKWVFNRNMWVSNEEHVDYRKLAAEVMNDVDIETDCDCFADLYYGGEYIRTQRRSKYGDKENRPPVKKNPKQYGSMCKHGQLVFDVLPFYVSTFSSYLKKFYKPEIDRLEIKFKQELGGVKKATKELGKKVEEPIARKGKLPPEVEEPKEKEEIKPEETTEEEKK